MNNTWRRRRLQRPAARFSLGWVWSAGRICLAVVMGGLVIGQAPSPAQEPSEDPLDQPLTSLWKRHKGADWPQFLGSGIDGRSSETGIRRDWTGGKLPLLWQLPLGESYGICSIAAGRVYQFDRLGDLATLLCLEAETGRELWRFEYETQYEDLYGYNGGPRCSPLIEGSRLYIFGVEGWMHCLHAGTGEILWKVDTADRFGVIQNFFGVGSNPVIVGDLLWVMVGGSPASQQATARGRLDRVTGDNSGLVAFDKRTGKVKHRLTDELASYASLKAATIEGRPWCFAFARSGLVAFDPATAEVHFQFPWRARLLESVNASTPVVVGDQVLISEAYGIGGALLKARPGAFDVVWQDDRFRRDKALMTHWNTPVHHEGFVYASSGRHAGEADLRCVELSTGRVAWSQERTTRCSLMGVEDCMVVLGEYGDLYLIRATPLGYQEITRAEGMGRTADRLAGERGLLRYPCWAAPALAHGLLYVRGDDRLACFELIAQTSDE